MAHNADVLEVRLGAQGRVVIPAPLRRALGVDVGDRLLAHLEDDRLVLEKAESIKLRLKGRFSRIGKGVSLAAELIAERREEAKLEVKD